jgi:hypothetical protein
LEIGLWGVAGVMTLRFPQSCVEIRRVLRKICFSRSIGVDWRCANEVFVVRVMLEFHEDVNELNETSALRLWQYVIYFDAISPKMEFREKLAWIHPHQSV